MANVSLDETLFYQYMINNNSTSTMLNALSGTNAADNSSNSLLSALGSLQGMNSWGTGSISDVATLLGLGNSTYGGIGSVGSFSNVLQTYMNAGQQDAAELTEKIEGVMEEVADTPEAETRSYQTLQEVYQYFQEQTSDRAANLLSALTGTTEQSSASENNQSNAGSEILGAADFDFDAFETETDEMIDSMMNETEML